jgi:hypothetical protein
LSTYNIKSIAYILIPATENPTRVNTDEDDTQSAKMMVQTIQNWMLNNRELEVYLVDRVGGFQRISYHILTF